MLVKYKKHMRFVVGLVSLTLVGMSKPEDSKYIPYVLDTEGLSPGKCTITNLATSLENAKQWAEESAGWIKVYSVHEYPLKIVFN